MDDADEAGRTLVTVSLWAAAGLFVSAALLSGPLAVAAAMLGGTALATGLITAFAPGRPDDDGEWQASSPQEEGIGTAAEPQQAARLHVDAPKSVRRWLERVEHTADAEAAKRGR
jgi:hypothetical protein